MHYDEQVMLQTFDCRHFQLVETLDQGWCLTVRLVVWVSRILTWQKPAKQPLMKVLSIVKPTMSKVSLLLHTYRRNHIHNPDQQSDTTTPRSTTDGAKRLGPRCRRASKLVL